MAEAEPMQLPIVVPHRGLAAAKTRLAGVLSPDERVALAGRLLRRVLEAIRLAGLGPAVVITPDAALSELVEAAGGRVMVQRGMGLNEGLEEARSALVAEGATRMAVLHGDLPDLTPDDIRALVEALPEGVAIAPDAAGRGTNGLVLQPIGAIPFRFGRDSHAAHRRAVEERGLALATVARPGLAFDLDTPEDLEAWLARTATTPVDAA